MNMPLYEYASGGSPPGLSRRNRRCGRTTRATRSIRCFRPGKPDGELTAAGLFVAASCSLRRREEAVDLMGSDPFITAVEEKKRGFWLRRTVSRGSDRIKSTLLRGRRKAVFIVA